MFLKAIIINLLIYQVNAEYCKIKLGNLGDCQKNFVNCITHNAVPVTMCITCNIYYDQVLKSYDDLFLNCSDVYFNKDRINLVASTQSVLTGLWAKAFCDDCFANNNQPKFNEKYTKFGDCINKTNSNDPCNECKAEYSDLNNFYINLDQHNNGKVCFDLQDEMNRTRNFWSKELKCCPREQNLNLFIIALCLTSCLPLLFYGITFFITKRQEHRHRILYDEDPIYRSNLPSTSQNPTTSSHNPMLNNLSQPMTNNASSSEAGTGYSSAVLKKAQENAFHSHENSESSDDDALLLKSKTN